MGKRDKDKPRKGDHDKRDRHKGKPDKGKRWRLKRKKKERAEVETSQPEAEATSRTMAQKEPTPPSTPDSVIPPKASAPRRVRYESENEAPPEPPVEPPVSRETRVAAVLPRPRRTTRYVVANQKGGVGKTTTTVNLAAAMAAGGLRVLVVDIDPQGNASTALGVDHEVGVPGTYEVLLEDAPIASHVVRSPEEGELWVLPATIDLAAAELELVMESGREARLKHAVERFVGEHQVDVVFFDCPPSLGLLTLNALVAADELIVPIQCEYYALEGVTQLMRTINRVKGALNDDLAIGPIVLTMYDGRTRLSREVADEVRRHFGENVLATPIPRSVRVSEAPSYGSSVLSYDPGSAGAQAYRAAAEEIARRLAAQ